MVGFLVRGRLRRLRDWARWVSVYPGFEFSCMNRPCVGMGLLYYGQNFLIYPSAFPAGARESAFTPCPLLVAISDLTNDLPRFYVHSYLMARRPCSVRLFDSIYGT